MVVVSHLFLFLCKSFRGRCDSHESHLPLFGTTYFPTAPSEGDAEAIKAVLKHYDWKRWNAVSDNDTSRYKLIWSEKMVDSNGAVS